MLPHLQNDFRPCIAISCCQWRGKEIQLMEDQVGRAYGGQLRTGSPHCCAVPATTGPTAAIPDSSAPGPGMSHRESYPSSRQLAKTRMSGAITLAIYRLGNWRPMAKGFCLGRDGRRKPGVSGLPSTWKRFRDDWDILCSRHGHYSPQCPQAFSPISAHWTKLVVTVVTVHIRLDSRLIQSATTLPSC